MARSRAVDAREPGQVREEAALSDSVHAPRGSLAGVRGRRERSKADLDGGCTVRFCTRHPPRARVAAPASGRRGLLSEGAEAQVGERPVRVVERPDRTGDHDHGNEQDHARHNGGDDRSRFLPARAS